MNIMNVRPQGRREMKFTTDCAQQRRLRSTGDCAGHDRFSGWSNNDCADMTCEFHCILSGLKQIKIKGFRFLGEAWFCFCTGLVIRLK